MKMEPKERAQFALNRARRCLEDGEYGAAVYHVEQSIIDAENEARQADNAMGELCARLREHFESAGHPVCPDPECGEPDGLHVPGCAYVKYVQAQDTATAAA